MSATNGHTNGNGHKKRQNWSKRKYSDQEKAAALAYLDFCKGNLTEACAKLGIPYKTLSCWRDERGIVPAVAELHEEKKADIAELLEKVVVASLQAKQDRGGSITGIETGIYIDKLLLLRGHATVINEHRNGTPDERKARLLQLTDKAKVA